MAMQGSKAKHLESRLRLLERQLTVLEQAAQVFGAMSRGEDVISQLNQQVAELLDCEMSAILLYEEERRGLVGQTPAVGVPDREIAAYFIPLDEDSPARQFWETGDDVLLNDTPTNPVVQMMGLADFASQLRVQHSLMVGMRSQGRLIGVIQPSNKRDGTPFNQESDVRLLKIYANQAAVAIENSRLLTALREEHDAILRERDKLDRLHQVTVAVQQAETLDDKLKLIAEGMREVGGYGRVVISLRDADLNAIGLVCAGLTPEEEAYVWEHAAPAEFWRRCLGGEFERFRLGEFYYLPGSDPWVQQEIDQEGILESRVEGELAEDGWQPYDLLYLPLRDSPLSGSAKDHERVRAIVALDEPVDGRRPTVEGLRIIELFAQEAVLAMENLRLLDDLRKLNADLKSLVDTQRGLLETLRELSSPVIPIFEGIIVLPLIGNIDTQRASQVLEGLLAGIERYRAQVVLMDVTGVPVVDTSVANHLLKAAQATRLLGAEAVLVGVRPEVAQTMVQLGVDHTGLTTRADLQSGVEYAFSRLNLRLARR
jgi:anti-anti-sigma regulatory factor/GAF domain-containing protein